MEADPVERLSAFLRSLAPLAPLPVYVGIDPGKEGAIAVVCGSKCACFDMPTLKSGLESKGGDHRAEYDEHTIGKLLRIFASFRAKTDRAAIFGLERGMHVSRVPGPRCPACRKPKGGDTAMTSYKTAQATWMFPLALSILGLPCTLFAPISWISKLGLRKSGKDGHLAAARRLYPQADFLARKKDHNRADAVLIATCVRRVTEGVGI